MMREEMQAYAKEEGQKLILRRISTAAYSPATSTAAVTSVDIEVLGFITDYKDRQRDGTLIKAADRKATIIACDRLKTAPAITDLIVDGACNNREYQIVNVQESRESGQVFAYRLQIRG